MGIWYDFFILLLIFGGMLLGFSLGLVRQSINVLGLYFGIVAASYFHPTIMRWIRQQLGETSDFSRETFIFFLVFALVWLFINGGAYYSFRTAPRFLPAAADRLLGMLLGVFTGVLSAVLITMLLSYSTEVAWPRNNEVRIIIQRLIDQSTLRDTLLAQVFPTLTRMVEPWLPSGLPAFFTIGF